MVPGSIPGRRILCFRLVWSAARACNDASWPRVRRHTPQHPRWTQVYSESFGLKPSPSDSSSIDAHHGTMCRSDGRCHYLFRCSLTSGVSNKEQASIDFANQSGCVRAKLDAGGLGRLPAGEAAALAAGQPSQPSFSGSQASLAFKLLWLSSFSGFQARSLSLSLSETPKLCDALRRRPKLERGLDRYIYIYIYICIYIYI